MMWRFAPLEESDLPPVKPPSVPSSPAEIEQKGQDTLESESTQSPPTFKFSRKFKQRNVNQKKGFGHR